MNLHSLSIYIYSKFQITPIPEAKMPTTTELHSNASSTDNLFPNSAQTKTGIDMKWGQSDVSFIRTTSVVTESNVLPNTKSKITEIKSENIPINTGCLKQPVIDVTKWSQCLKSENVNLRSASPNTGSFSLHKEHYDHRDEKSGVVDLSSTRVMTEPLKRIEDSLHVSIYICTEVCNILYQSIAFTYQLT